MEKALGINANQANSERRRVELLNYEIKLERVSTIQEAINALKCCNTYLFIGICEDYCPELMLELPLLRDVTDIPIFVITSTYTFEKKIQFMELGADEYYIADGDGKNEIVLTLTLLKKYNRLLKHQSEFWPILNVGDVTLSPSQRTVVVQDAQIKLTKKEFDILCTLMSKPEHVVPYTYLLKKIWGEEYSDHDIQVLWRTVNRLRNKLLIIPFQHGIIATERGIGYKFTVN